MVADFARDTDPSGDEVQGRNEKDDSQCGQHVRCSRCAPHSLVPIPPAARGSLVPPRYQPWARRRAIAGNWQACSSSLGADNRPAIGIEQHVREADPSLVVVPSFAVRDLVAGGWSADFEQAAATLRFDDGVVRPGIPLDVLGRFDPQVQQMGPATSTVATAALHKKQRRRAATSDDQPLHARRPRESPW